jgi:ppGpp synthetase/RelA/SpoT-type nucleotidyltranferase
MPMLLGCLATAGICADPFLALSRFFCRLKSADSIVEKLRRKRIEFHDPRDLLKEMPDILGFRIIVANQQELHAVDAFLRTTFEIIRVDDRNSAPDEFGRRGVDYSALRRDGEKQYHFELQLRTFLQHYWAVQTFRYFHKQPKEIALSRQSSLQALAESLAEADRQIGGLGGAEAAENMRPTRVDLTPLADHIHLVVIEAGEQFAEFSTLTLTGHSAGDHAEIVKRKMSFYEKYPGAAIVECACMGFLSFHLNEPLVRVPLERVGRTKVG